nr:hypothetical protein [uncultured Lacibacter sp.]
MKHSNNRLLIFLLMFGLTGALSCKKEVPSIFNMFDVTLDLNKNSPYSVVENQTVEEGDSLYFDFTIKSPTKDMYQVAIFQVGSALPFLRINLSKDERRSYTGVLKTAANANGTPNFKDGANTFRIWAYDQQGVYLGDGYKTITVNVTPKYVHIPNRIVYFPDVDSANGSANSYLSLMDGKTYNYQTGAASSASIDLAIFRNITVSGGVTSYGLRLYSLSASPLPYNAFNISSWTKRVTKFAAPHTNQATQFVRSQLTSGAAIKAYAVGRNPNQTSITSNIAINSVIAFVTPEGKYGAILINNIENNGPKPFIDVSIKYEK